MADRLRHANLRAASWRQNGPFRKARYDEVAANASRPPQDADSLGFRHESKGSNNDLHGLGTIGTVVAGVAAVATLIVTIASQASASFRFDLWIRVLNNALNEHKRDVAADRVDYFVVLAVAQFMRRRRTQFVVVGLGTAFASLVAIVIGTALARVEGPVAYWTGWAIVILGG